MMQERVFYSHSDLKAEATSMVKRTEMPGKIISGRETPYDKVLQTMRNQESLFYSSSLRSGY